MNRDTLIHFIHQTYSISPEFLWSRYAVFRHPGIFSAYHMNKTHWLSLALDGTVAPDLIQSLLAHSFILTQK